MYSQHNVLVIIGAGGHAKVCYEIAHKMKRWSEIILLDDQSENHYFDVKGPVHQWVDYSKYADFFCAIGDNQIRQNIIDKISDSRNFIATLVSQDASISDNVTIHEGSVVMAGVTINPCVQIGRGCIINTSSSIDHDCQIGDFVHISPGCHLGGNVQVGHQSWLGIGTLVIHNINITDHVSLGSSSNVIENIMEQGVYVGNPARKIK